MPKFAKRFTDVLTQVHMTLPLAYRGWTVRKRAFLMIYYCKSGKEGVLIPDGYDLVGDEYVRIIRSLSHTEIENQIEANAPLFFSKIGYNLSKVPRADARTPDYEYEDMGIEVTAVREYLPKKEVDELLARYEQTNCRICAYMYLKDDKPNIQILDEQKLNNNKLSILCLRQHVSCYRRKIISKIHDKYSQDKSHSILIIMMDFRLAHFDTLSLKREIKSILAGIGMQLPSLGGILVSIPRKLNSDLLSNECDYVFVNNTYCKSQHAVLKQLNNNYSLTSTSDWITINSAFIKTSTPVLFLSVPCSDCPDRFEIERKGLPTFQF